MCYFKVKVKVKNKIVVKYFSILKFYFFSYKLLSYYGISLLKKIIDKERIAAVKYFTHLCKISLFRLNFKSYYS